MRLTQSGAEPYVFTNGGGIHVTDGYYADRRYLNEEQENMLRKILPELSTADQIIMDEILKKFSKPKEPPSLL